MAQAEAYKTCQSCGMPMKKDEAGGGTNADGTRSAVYCSHCYVRGKFTLPNLSAADMQDRVRGRMQEMGFPKILAGLFVRRIPKLKRWTDTAAR